MATSFSSLPIVDVGVLKKSQLEPSDSQALSKQLYDVFATTGFAYLTNCPLSFDHNEIFSIAKEFFALPLDDKMKLAKRSFRPAHENTYRGYFPTQPHLARDNLKEGFEMGNPGLNDSQDSSSKSTRIQKIKLSEGNVWPWNLGFSKQGRLEHMYNELQAFAGQLLSLLAGSLGKPTDCFDSWLDDSLSTLRLLHYPPVRRDTSSELVEAGPVKLSCTPHTDSGILTLLHQDATGGLEVLNAAGEWVAAPYVSGSIVVNIGDLMARVSGGRFTATMHRVRAPPPKPDANGLDGEFGRFSIPFFFEPGESGVVVLGDGSSAEKEEKVVYGEYVKGKMSTWVEYQEDSGYETGGTAET